MAVWQNCCCCSVKIASQAFSILGLLWYIVSVVLEIISLNNYDDTHYQPPDGFYTMFVASMIVSSIGILVYASLVFGIFKQKEMFIIPVLIYMPLNVIYKISIMIAEIVKLGLEEYWHSISYIVTGVLSVVMVFLSFVIWMVYYSYRKQMKESKNGNHYNV